MPVDFNITNVDQHPLRYSRLESVIEDIIYQREMERNKETGYVHGTLPTAVLIADATVQHVRSALCEYCAAGSPYIEAEGWLPNMFHDWPDGGVGARVKCYAFDTIQRITKKL